MSRIALITLTLILGATSAVAAPQSRSGEIVVEGSRAHRDKMLCKQAVATGSILRATTCKTQGEWEQQRQRDIAALGTAQRALETRREVNEICNTLPEACIIGLKQ